MYTLKVFVFITALCRMPMFVLMPIHKFLSPADRRESLFIILVRHPRTLTFILKMALLPYL